LVPLVEDAIGRVEADGCDVTVLACTDEFPRLIHRAPLLHAGALLSGGVSALASNASTIGVIAPLAEQAMQVAEQWRSTLHTNVLVAFADPYSEASTSLAGEASLSLVRRGAQLLLLDCMGYRSAHRAACARAGVPVLLARSVVGRLVAEFVSSAEPGMAQDT
jgi:protein AroM